MGCFKSKMEDTDVCLDSEAYAPLLDESSSARGRDDFNDNRVTTTENREKNADYGLEKLLLRLQHALTWRNIYVDVQDMSSLAELRTKIHELLNFATVEMGYLVRDKRYSEAEDIVNAILRLKSSLGNELVDAVQITAFVREVTTFSRFVLSGGQYFEPMMVNEDDENVLKLFFFLVSDTETRQTMFRYYVEYTSLIEEFFALVLVTSSGHVRLEMYGSSCPSYWEIRQDVIKNAREKIKSFDFEEDDEY
ncbi:uncharacterized protein LOC116297469 [Actinia tenebrosa]|uniref:Uncharacterized protein LOC116297469 n=1 Tax=Actinia tenebrosa TaxID=6105 RepID=A0A6P8I1Y5_ACTTE|nr:uncharacterized protein LOC116297469 [Actinia tenebrosa]